MRHARAVLVVAESWRVAAAVAATRVDTDAGVGTLVGKGDPTYQATQRVRAEFGEEPVVVLVEESLQQLLLTEDLLRGCCGSRAASRARCRRGRSRCRGPCTELAAMEPVTFLAGPATFLNEAVVQIDEQLERLRGASPPNSSANTCSQVATQYGITSRPASQRRIRRHRRLRPRQGARTPKSRLAYLFPNSHSAQIVIRLKPGLSEAERHRAIGLIKGGRRNDAPQGLRGKRQADAASPSAAAIRGHRCPGRRRRLPAP